MVFQPRNRCLVQARPVYDLSDVSCLVTGTGSITNADDFAPSLVSRLRKLVGGGSEYIALHEPEFAGEEWQLVKQCLDTGWVSTAGEFVTRFERELAGRCETEHCVAVVNGTAALHLALVIADVEPGDEVIVPALTFVATANAVHYAGATPHLVDSAFDTLGVDPEKLAEHLAEICERRDGATYNTRTGKRLAAIIPMHTFGHPVDMDPLLSVAEEFGLTVIEDAAEALGSNYKNRPCGSIGKLGVLSFNGNKVVTTGGGGAVVTNDPELAGKARHLSTTAKLPHRWAFNHDQVGFNYRMPNINAALGCAQLDQLDSFLSRKRQLAQHYADGLADFPGLAVVQEPGFAKSNYWLNAVLLDDDHAGLRDTILDQANEAGLMCRPAWTPMHELPMHKDVPRAALPVAAAIHARLINLPSSARLAEMS